LFSAEKFKKNFENFRVFFSITCSGINYREAEINKLFRKVLSKLHTKNRVCFTQTCLVFSKMVSINGYGFPSEGYGFPLHGNGFPLQGVSING
jgi:hypothetical protein